MTLAEMEDQRAFAVAKVMVLEGEKDPLMRQFLKSYRINIRCLDQMIAKARQTERGHDENEKRELERPEGKDYGVYQRHAGQFGAGRQAGPF